MKKLLSDILKSGEKWSIKRITIFLMLIFALLLGTFITISDKILEVEVNKYAIEVFNSILLFLATLMGVTEFGKKLTNKTHGS